MGWDVDDEIKKMKMQRYFGVDLLQPLCKRCGAPTRTYAEFIDGGGNIEKEYELFCDLCLRARIQNTSVGCDE